MSASLMTSWVILSSIAARLKCASAMASSSSGHPFINAFSAFAWDSAAETRSPALYSSMAREVRARDCSRPPYNSAAHSAHCRCNLTATSNDSFWSKRVATARTTVAMSWHCLRTLSLCSCSGKRRRVSSIAEDLRTTTSFTSSESVGALAGEPRCLDAFFAPNPFPPAQNTKTGEDDDQDWRSSRLRSVNLFETTEPKNSWQGFCGQLCTLR
mmetsp:Transcript_23408/g.40276  ORF Transcript_23408/g.40276 Transcript_23408/m.40276 type:complete len:213 (+) Transcript_23408:373-1011(+)